MTNIDEVAAAFEQFDLQTHDPKWSSWVLEQLVEETLRKPDASMTDLFRGLDLALNRNAVNLTETVANLIKDTVVTGFTKHKAAYSQAEWDWANDELSSKLSASRSYLFLHALPPDKASPTALVSILCGLEGSSRFEEAVETLSDDFERPEVLLALQRWRVDGMRPTTKVLFQPLLAVQPASS